MKKIESVIKTYTYDEIPLAVAHHLGNPVSAIDSFVVLAKKYLERGDVAKALECLNSCDDAIEDAKAKIFDFKTGNISFKADLIND